MRRSDWRKLKPCSNCPFSDSEAGKALWDSLHPLRREELHQHLIEHEGTFNCHKTVRYSRPRGARVCAGSLNYQHQHGVTSQCEQVMERLEKINNG